MHVPDKYLALHASFQVMKSELARIGISQIDVPGILSGTSVAYIGILQEIFFSNKYLKYLSINGDRGYRLSPGMTDLRFLETVFRISRAELGVSSKLQVEQFMSNGSFITKKIEFLTCLARAISRAPSVAAPTLSSTTQCQSSCIVEDTGRYETPIPHPQPPTASCQPDPVIHKILNLISEISKTIGQIDIKISNQIEALSARTTLIEGRLRIYEKVGSLTCGN
jgi:hypothetical protein